MGNNERKGDWEHFITAIIKRRVYIPNPNRKSPKKKILLRTYIGYLREDKKNPRKDPIVDSYYKKFLKFKNKKNLETGEKRKRILQALTNPKVLSYLKKMQKDPSTKKREKATHLLYLADKIHSTAKKKNK